MTLLYRDGIKLQTRVRRGGGACLVSCSVVMQEKGRIRVTKREGGVRVQVNPTQGHVALTRFRSTQAVPSLSSIIIRGQLAALLPGMLCNGYEFAWKRYE